MAKTNDQSKLRSARNQLRRSAAAEAQSPPLPAGDHHPPAPPRSRLEQAIEAGRLQLLQARAVLACLYEVLLHAEGEDAVWYAEAANVAGRLIDESVERLDAIRLQPLIGELKRAGDPQTAGEPLGSRAGEIRDRGAPYLH